MLMRVRRAEFVCLHRRNVGRGVVGVLEGIVVAAALSLANSVRPARRSNAVVLAARRAESAGRRLIAPIHSALGPSTLFGSPRRSHHLTVQHVIPSIHRYGP